ncbi:DEAD/DEAH box helicase [Salinimicrobium oceani]|uniref:DEAD/DEAH box helicase family protein n=1 Tax=Salinimicrobium oceani TaxID=2722702 RepID=A0ABX1D6G1_9FLAO|nr:DEAD/DEAH box helicase family protein [Salinimicrobium oceani]NJW54161.1 DEAD/DEAH box helicase family protein [Salinimicrobium oceani]
MGLIKLISNLNSSTKTELLGENITKILRYTFVQSDYDVVDDFVINEAVALQVGEDLVRRKKDLLLESCRLQELRKFGFDSHDEAIKHYEKNPSAFVNDFEIEEEYLQAPLKDDRVQYEIDIPKYGECNGVNAFPHDYQFRLKSLIVHKFFNNLNPVILASMPTGAGKTVLGMEIIVDLIRSYSTFKKKNIKCLWLVTSKELSEQSLKSFQKVWKQKGDQPVIAERYFGRFNNIKETTITKITFATFDLLVSRRDSLEGKSLLKETDFLFIDEAHSSDAFTYADVIQQYKSSNPNYKILGLTATPHRSEDTEFKTLKDLFTDYLTLTDEHGAQVESPLQFLIDRQYLAKIRFEILDISEGGIGLAEYFRTLHNAVLNQCKWLLNNSMNTIIFAKSKAHAVALSIYLKQNEIENGLIVGETSDQKRGELLSRFGDKKDSLSVLVNHQILSTGIDVPGMNSIMVLSDINSPTLALQILGRAMRGPKNGGNYENIIFLTPTNQQKLKEYKILENIVLN